MMEKIFVDLFNERKEKVLDEGMPPVFSASLTRVASESIQSFKLMPLSLALRFHYRIRTCQAGPLYRSR